MKQEFSNAVLIIMCSLVLAYCNNSNSHFPVEEYSHFYRGDDTTTIRKMTISDTTFIDYFNQHQELILSRKYVGFDCVYSRGIYINYFLQANEGNGLYQPKLAIVPAEYPTVQYHAEFILVTTTPEWTDTIYRSDKLKTFEYNLVGFSFDLREHISYCEPGDTIFFIFKAQFIDSCTTTLTMIKEKVVVFPYP